MALPLAARAAAPAYGKHYVDCAFNFNDGSDVAVLFTGRQCLQFNYVNDFLIKGLLSIVDFFPCLAIPEFSEGIDSAFTSSVKNQVYMFKKDSFVLLNFTINEGGYIVGSEIVRGPKKITDEFECLKGTVFKDGIDAAFASDQSNKAYIFNKKQYALLNFIDHTLCIAPQDFTNDFPCLSSSPVFKDGLDAAFNSSTKNEAYIFRNNTYAIFNYGQEGISHGFQSLASLGDPVSPITKGFTSLEGSIPSST